MKGVMDKKNIMRNMDMPRVRQFQPQYKTRKKRTEKDDMPQDDCKREQKLGFLLVYFPSQPLPADLAVLATIICVSSTVTKVAFSPNADPH
ncbi:MAG: hypothetical protein D9C04_06215 [Nitrosopumilus sp. B06]|nr:MAG: hypothetical protein D9C04_06215 [Nitrosopumilus sp. B06]